MSQFGFNMSLVPVFGQPQNQRQQIIMVRRPPWQSQLVFVTPQPEIACVAAPVYQIVPQPIFQQGATYFPMVPNFLNVGVSVPNVLAAPVYPLVQGSVSVTVLTRVMQPDLHNPIPAPEFLDDHQSTSGSNEPADL